MNIDPNTEPLSDHPGVALEQALADLEACEQDSRYIIVMHVFHNPGQQGEPCKICLSGSVMAKRYNLPIDQTYYWDSGIISNKLDCIDSARIGLWWDFCDCWLRHSVNQTVVLRLINEVGLLPNYHEDREAFFAGMRHAIAILREEIPLALAPAWVFRERDFVREGSQVRLQEILV